MNALKALLSGSRQARGMSSTATLIIAIVLVLLGWRLVMFLLVAVAGLLRVAIEIGVLIAVVLAVALIVKYLAKKMS